MTYLAGFAQALGVANPLGAAVRNSFAQRRRHRPRRGLRADAVGFCRGRERRADRLKDREGIRVGVGSGGRIRTGDLRIMIPLL